MGEKRRDVWFSLKKSLQHCKSEPSDVHNPETKKQLTAILTKKTGRSSSGCSRSFANLKDVVIHGSKRHPEKPATCSHSPRSIGSSEFLNPLTHQVILSNSTCELKITGSSFAADGFRGGGTFVAGAAAMRYLNPAFKRSVTPPRKSKAVSVLTESEEGVGNGGSVKFGNLQKRGSSFEKDGDGVVVTCHKCGEQFVKWEALESHHLSKHVVTELLEGDSSRKIVEIICRSSCLMGENHCVRIDRVLKVHNMQKTLARFEDYRETVKAKASKLPKKHPRCLADGNELLRFYGTTLACSLGTNGYSALCVSDKCCVCRIIRLGFSTERELKDGVGVFTTSTSGRAFESTEIRENDVPIRKALIVCRVIAGRVHRPLENVLDMVGQAGFDSLAGKVGLYSNIEDLYLLNPKALLPCFVVTCKN